MISLTPKSIRKFKRENAYNTARDAWVGLHFTNEKGRHSHMLVSVEKRKGGNFFGLKVDLDSKIAQAQTEKAAQKIFNGLYPHAQWADQWAMSGGMLYRIWPSISADRKTASNKILRAIKRVILVADREVK